MEFSLFQGDCIEVMRGLPDNSVDSVCTDPPYGLKFMGHRWDCNVPSVDVWREVFRVLKPGGHLLSFSGTRTYHRMVVNIEDAGFEIRDQIMWVYGSGFPKSKNLDGEWQGWGTALKPAHEPICVARKPLSAKTVAANVILHGTGAINIDACRVELQGESDAAEFENNHRVTERLPESYDGELLGLHDGGWKQRVGAAVIPTGRWPANLMHDGSDEVVSAFPDSKGQQGDLKGHSKSRKSPNGCFGEMAAAADHPARNDAGSAARFFYSSKASKKDRNSGCEGVLSWENVDLSEQIQSVLSHLKGTSEIITALQVDCECGMTWFGSNTSDRYLTVTMFIIETVSKLITELTTSNFCQSSITRESILVAIRMLREHGLSLVESAENISRSIANTTSGKTGSALGAVVVLLKTLSEISEKGKPGNTHSTVKPTDVCRWLLRLVTPPGGTSLDLYCGSGSFGKAAILEGFNWIGIDRDRDEEGNSLGYLDIARARCLDAQCEASGL